MIKIRKFLLSDLEKVMNVEKVSFPKNRAYPRSYFEKYFKRYPQGFIVAEDRGKILGYAIGEMRNRVPAKRVGEFVSLAVKPEFRKKGIGRELTNFLINLFEKEGVKNISLNVRAENKIAISFYKNLGFKIVKRVKKYYRNGDDAYIMNEKLGA